MDTDDPLELAAGALRSDTPCISAAMKNFCSVLAASDIAASSGSDGTVQQQKPHDMEHLLACARIMLRSINGQAQKLATVSQWESANPQGAEESALDRITAITNYKACHLLAGQINATAGAKHTKLLGRKFLQASGISETAREAARIDLNSQRFPPHTVDAFLSGWSDAIWDQHSAAEGGASPLEASSLVWAADFNAALKARQAARLEEVRERRERLDNNEDEAERLREALRAEDDPDGDGDADGRGANEEDEPRVVEMA